MYKKSAYRHLNWRNAHRSLPQLLAGLGMLFISVGVIVGILYSVSGLQTSQDLRRDASAEVAYDLFLSHTDIQIAKRSPDGVAVSALLFADDFLLSEQADITYTWQTDTQGIVSLAPQQSVPGAVCIDGLQAPCPDGVRLEIKPLALGSTSLRVVAQKNGVQLGTAETTITVVDRLDGGKNASMRPFEDLYFTDQSTNTARFFSDKNKTTELKLADLESGKQYWVEYQISINNHLKSKFLGKYTLLVTAEVNGESFSNELEYYQVAASLTGLKVTALKQFTARPTNIVQFHIDPSGRFAESDENNNTYNLDFSATIPEKEFASCDKRCSNNAQCDAGLSCVTVGSEKRCRNPQNTSNTSCSSSTTRTSTVAANKSCNEGCANSNECAVGLTCWYNKCRDPQFLDSTSCATAVGGVQENNTSIVGCNQACVSNRDCSSGLRCYQNTCRYPLNPTSQSCSPQTNTTSSSTSTKGGTATTTSPSTGGTLLIPSGTTRPAASSTPRPTATTATTSAEATPLPTPSPLATPLSTVTPAPQDETALDALSLSIGGYFSGLFSGDTFAGVPLPLLVIGLGILFLVIAVAILVISSLRKSHSQTSITHSSDFKPQKASEVKTPVPFTPSGAVTPPPAPGVMQKARQQHTLHAIQNQAPAAQQKPLEPITRPGEQVAPQAQVITRPAPAQASSSAPAAQHVAPTPAATPAAPTPVTQPVTSPPLAPLAPPAPSQTPTLAHSAPSPTPDQSAARKPGSLVERLKQKGIEVPSKPQQ